MIKKTRFWSKKGKQSGESFGESTKPRSLALLEAAQIPPQCPRKGEGAELVPSAAGPGAGADLLCVCLKAFPPNRNKPLISLKGAEPRGCSAGAARGAQGWALLGNFNFSARTLALAGEERSSGLKGRLNFARPSTEGAAGSVIPQL